MKREIQQNGVAALQNVMDCLTDGVIVADQKGEFLLFNREAERILGLGAQNIEPDDWSTAYGCFYPDRETPFPSDQLPLARAIRGEEVRDELIYISNPHVTDGVWIRVSGRPLTKKGRGLYGGVVVFRDVTERQLVDEHLRQTVSRLTTLIDSLQSGVLLENERREILFVNRQFCELFNLPFQPSELIGMNCAQAAENIKTTFVDGDEFVSRTNQLLTDKSTTTNEEYRLTDGRIFERDYIPVYTDEVYAGHLWQYRDVTERRKTRQIIRVSERLSEALEQTADSVLITDRQGRIEYVNGAFERITGYSKDEVLGQSPRILKSGKHDPEYYRELWGRILAGESFENTVINKKKTGELFWSRQTITPMKDSDGSITHFVSVLKDITELLKAQEQEYEMRLAREVQQRFYRTLSPVPGFDIAGSSHPTKETGGDYFDLLPMENGNICIAIGDVCRHGISSALLMAETRAYLRAFATSSSDVGQILTRVNHALTPDLTDGGFVTLCLVCLNPGRRSVRYANAGHIPGLLINGSSGVDSVLESTGPPLGLRSEFDFSISETVYVKTGQILLLMTDGVPESLVLEDLEAGISRAVDYVRDHKSDSADLIARGLCEAAQMQAVDQEHKDDVTAVILKIRGDSPNTP